MEDLLKVTGFYNSAPVVEVLGRAYMSPAVEIEKLTDVQVSWKKSKTRREERREKREEREEDRFEERCGREDQLIPLQIYSAMRATSERARVDIGEFCVAIDSDEIPKRYQRTGERG